MNIPLFIESLTDSEKEELKNYFFKELSSSIKEKQDENTARITILQFIADNKMSVRLTNALCSKRNYWDYNAGKLSEKLFVFNFVDEINKKDFLKIRNAGLGSWTELENIFKNNNLPISDC